MRIDTRGPVFKFILERVCCCVLSKRTLARALSVCEAGSIPVVQVALAASITVGKHTDTQCVATPSVLRKNASALALMLRCAVTRSTPGGSPHMSGVSLVSCGEHGERKT